MAEIKYEIKEEIRPDIVVRKNGTGSVVIMDTKWKRLKPDPNITYGISQADMYQMYAYSKKYHTSDIWLLYPLDDTLSELGEIRFIAEREEDKKVNVRIFFIDLADYRNSIAEIFRNVEEGITSEAFGKA